MHTRCVHAIKYVVFFYINTYHMVAGGRAGGHGRRRRRRSQGPDAVLFLETLNDRTHVRAVLVL